MRLFVLVILGLLTQLSYAKTVVITGGIKGFEHKIISANQFEDYITNDKLVLAETKISNGKFTLEFNLEKVQQVVLKIEDKSTSLFAEPGKTYNIGLSFDAEANQGNAFDKFLNISFVFPDPMETNSLIKTFNKSFQSFFTANYQMMILKKANRETEAFIKKQSQVDAYQKNEFVKNYVRYALANLEDIIGVPKEDLYSKYIKDQTILYSNKEYMNFFTQFYQSDFEKLTLIKQGQAILHAITFDQSFEKTIESVKAAKGFQSDALAELYLCYGLYEVFHNKRVNQDASLNMLKQIATNASNSENRILADNIREKLKLYGKNQPAPSFKLKNLNGKEYQLNDFKGKVVYLNFWANWSIPSLREMQIIKSLHEKYQDKVNFISINVDEGIATLEKIQGQRNYPWTMLHYGDDYKVRERFNVRTVPTYFLIDEDGKMLTPFAPNPTDIEKQLHELK